MRVPNKVFRFTEKGHKPVVYSTIKQLYEENHLLINMKIGSLMNLLCTAEGTWENELVKIERVNPVAAVPDDGKLIELQLV